MNKLISSTKIEDPDTFYMLNSMGSRKISYLGALVQYWENRTKEGLPMTFAEWIMQEEFMETTKRACKSATTDIGALKKELAETRGDLVESRKDIDRLIEVNKDLYQKYDEIKQQVAAAAAAASAPAPPQLSIDIVRQILIAFNKKNPGLVANGDPSGVTFEGHSKITSVESLAAFLKTVHARNLGLSPDILVKFKVFVLGGKLVTLSDEYHGGVGFSFLWKKKRGLKDAVVGWSTPEAKKYDPRLGIDPATGKKYVDPETGKTWVYNNNNNNNSCDGTHGYDASDASTVSKSKKRVGQELLSVPKKTRPGPEGVGTEATPGAEAKPSAEAKPGAEATPSAEDKEIFI